MNTDDTAFPLRQPRQLPVNVVHPFIREKGFDCEGSINNYAKCRMEVGVNAEGTISSGTDVDYWSVILPDADRDGVNIRYEITVLDPSGSNVDPYVRLYDKSGDLLAEDDNSGPGVSARVRYDVERWFGSVYHIEVTDANDRGDLGEGDDYIISVTRIRR